VTQKRDNRGISRGFLNGCINAVVGYDIKADIPSRPNLKIVNDGKLSVDECVDMILDVIPSNLYEETDDTDYWNQYYADVNAPDAAPQEPSDFARSITEKYLVKGNRLLELGCGNGRDSIYFDQNGINVVAIDSSSQTIKTLNKWRSDNYRSVLFACDDFTCTNAVYQQLFDYVYSRFTLHSITELQEIGVIRNVSNALNKGGLFFIEVRSVNDDIYGMGEAAGRDAYIYNGHYRRFIRKNEMVERLKKYGGFEIVYSEEDRSFARYKDMDPPVIRIIARKSN
jgi:SAM-dependent methyltransferase